MPAGEVRAVHVQGNVHMIVGAGANVAVQVGPDGVVVVDTGGAGMGEKVLAAIRQLSDKPIRWIVNTTFRPDHIGGNEPIAVRWQDRQRQRGRGGVARERQRPDGRGEGARPGAALQHVFRADPRLPVQRRSR